jgi:hypothetical protein
LVLLGGGVAAGAYFANRSASSRGSPNKVGTSVARNNQSHNLPPLPPPTRTGQPSDPSGKPIIVLIQNRGDPFTIFVIQGRDWPRGVTITVRLAGHRRAVGHVLTDGAGSFNYAINQNEAYFPSGLPPGLYKVVVTTSTGIRATAKFYVMPPPGRGPPGQGPPPPQ